MQREIKKRAQLYAVLAVALALILSLSCYNLSLQPTINSGKRPSIESVPQLLRTFQSYNELRSFLLNKLQTPPIYVKDALQSASEAAGNFRINVEYSATNVQVTGVDEADIVKTDGEYVYFKAGDAVLILKAYPPEEAKLVSKINFKEDLHPEGLYVSNDGSKLAVVGEKYVSPIYRTTIYARTLMNTKTFVYVYDVSNKEKPMLERNFTISGGYFGSRSIGGYVYVVATQPAYVIYDTVILPKIYAGEDIIEIRPEQIYYCLNASDESYVFATIAAINMLDMHVEPTTLTMMMGGTSSLYVSASNAYITFHDSSGNTSVFRVQIAEDRLVFAAKGSVSGIELNQYSMDEYDGYFRIATTLWRDEESINSIYVMDMNLKVVGELTEIAPGEAIDSARFIGDRCYLATSAARRDPFFVIDLKNPRSPKVLGYLKIPGFTGYLHLYDDEHVIGIGRDEENKVKIAMFDVSDVTNPVEVSIYRVPGEWSETPVLSDPKAFLFSRGKELMAMPISLFDDGTWQGAYIFSINRTGFILKGKITHFETAKETDSSHWITRILYIDNVLYTLSDAEMIMHRLNDLSFIGEISF